MVSKTIIAATLAAAAGVSATPAGYGNSDNSGNSGTPVEYASIVGMSLRSASPIHYQQLNAAGGALWLGGETSTYCPLQGEQKKSCPEGKVTSLSYGQGRVSMNVMVPGGQQLYIDPKGALKYTQAHSAFIPPGSKTTGFSLENTGRGYGILSWAEGKNGGFYACPEKAEQPARWQVFANVGSTAGKDCLGFTLLASNYTESGPAAWQYA